MNRRELLKGAAACAILGTAGIVPKIEAAPTVSIVPRAAVPEGMRQMVARLPSGAVVSVVTDARSVTVEGGGLFLGDLAGTVEMQPVDGGDFEGVEGINGYFSVMAGDDLPEDWYTFEMVDGSLVARIEVYREDAWSAWADALAIGFAAHAILSHYGEMGTLDIRLRVQARTGVDASLGRIYADLGALEDARLLVSRQVAGGPERGGRPDRLWRLPTQAPDPARATLVRPEPRQRD